MCLPTQTKTWLGRNADEIKESVGSLSLIAIERRRVLSADDQIVGGIRGLVGAIASEAAFACQFHADVEGF